MDKERVSSSQALSYQVKQFNKPWEEMSFATHQEMMQFGLNNWRVEVIKKMFINNHGRVYVADFAFIHDPDDDDNINSIAIMGSPQEVKFSTTN